MTDKIKLFCIPFAGGSKYSFKEFTDLAQDKFNCIRLELPGRGLRAREPLLTSIELMADDIFNHVRYQCKAPYAIYGHSLGTLLGYLVTRRIIAHNLPHPIHLFFSGGKSPSVRDDDDKKIHDLPRDEFLKKIEDYGGNSRMVMTNKDLLDFFEPVLRADFEASDNFKYEPVAKIEIPITVMIGLDEEITKDEAIAWNDVTNGTVTIVEFPGNHFFIFDHKEEIVRIISNSLLGVNKNSALKL